jgi:hypothetical protein
MTELRRLEGTESLRRLVASLGELQERWGDLEKRHGPAARVRLGSELGANAELAKELNGEEQALLHGIVTAPVYTLEAVVLKLRAVGVLVQRVETPSLGSLEREIAIKLVKQVFDAATRVIGAARPSAGAQPRLF